ncbi:Na(+)-translocating NADH-quinone reductase subunit A [Aquimarina muelleri]|uniref:Na(+)-translocating NADH-quinone reductase subunit A n=1 Tax=Aquimarina muelleri TaxID=279356 RepID=A0A918N3Q7_9FLAO|nr:Na(+)-translocating NADH-quinone reductase subunit A [Aquimarina muelleri]MCX2764382.1 Na(+)-translocating NADH-quinone reductase subunit A [Aquimarina muelleri]GGX21793.1 Na(+)-translocating NADH-quinone reductase subunit A [Aquimarina muelleri]
MSKDIRIRKGLDIKLVGEAEKVTVDATKSNVYAIKPSDFHGIVPKVVAKQGTEVKAGEPLFYSKSNERMLFPSPVSGEIVEIVRGAKRKILAFKILGDKEQKYADFGIKDVNSMNGDAVKTHLLESGCWPFIKQRPYDVIANPDVAPKAIFISGYTTAPLAADSDYVLAGKEKELQTAVTALSKLTEGEVHVSIGKNANSPLGALNNVTKHSVSGPHPAGNVSVQIANIDPINKGETVWVVNPQDLIIIGELLLTGKFNAERIVALGGSSVKKPKYFKTKIGSEVSSIVYDSGVNDESNIRVISGDVLTGENVKPDGYLGYYHNTITVIPEGDDYEFFGWNKPVFNKISPSRALTFSWLFPNKKYELTANTNGEHRAFVVTGSYENVFPLDIYPLQLLKACAVNDLDAMEQLGMYEVAPEDFALTEFICVSKQPHQEIIREGLDLMLKEIG